MILHLVLFRFTRGTEPARIARAAEALRLMEGRIPEIRSLRWGPNLGPSAAEWSHVLAVECEDMSAVQRYLDHPVHRATIADHLQDIREARLAVDLER